MKSMRWLYVIFAVLLVIASVLVFLLVKSKNQENEIFVDNEFFYLDGQKVVSGHSSLSDDGTYLHAVVRLNKVYTSGGSILADVQWTGVESNRQTVEIGNSSDLKFTYVTKQSSRELFPLSTDMQTNRVDSQNVVSELTPYLNHDVIMGFYNVSPKINNEMSDEIKDYIKALQPHIQCNQSFVLAFEDGQSGTDCQPFSHVIYVVQN